MLAEEAVAFEQEQLAVVAVAFEQEQPAVEQAQQLQEHFDPNRLI